MDNKHKVRKLGSDVNMKVFQMHVNKLTKDQQDEMQKFLKEKLDISKITFYKWTTGERKPVYATAYAVAIVLGWEPELLFPKLK